LRRRNPVAQGHINGSGNMKIFVPFVVSSFGGLGPSAREFLNKAYSVARAKPWRYYLGVNHPTLHTTWNTMTAPTFWDARISVACSQADAEFQGRIIARDQLVMWPTQGRQPNPDPNFAPYAPTIGRSPQLGGAMVNASRHRTSHLVAPAATDAAVQPSPSQANGSGVGQDSAGLSREALAVSDSNHLPLFLPATTTQRDPNARGVVPSNLPAWMASAGGANPTVLAAPGGSTDAQTPPVQRRGVDRNQARGRGRGQRGHSRGQGNGQGRGRG
jgi:hypothetical protein